MLTSGMLSDIPSEMTFPNLHAHADTGDIPHVLFAPDAAGHTRCDFADGHHQHAARSSAGTIPAAYQAGTRWGSSSADGGSLNWGDSTTLTWSIVPDGTQIPGFVGERDGASDFVTFMGQLYGSVVGSVNEQPWFSLVESVFERWSEVSGLNFLYEPNDDGAAISNMASAAPGVQGVRGDVRIGGHPIDGSSGTLAYNFFPDNGEMVIDTSDDFFSDLSEHSLRLRNVLAHEIGHGVGLSHVEPVDGTKLMEPIASIDFDGPQLDDILAAHRLYGDMFEAGGGNDTTGTAVNLGSLDGRRVRIGDSTTDRYPSIDGRTDVDYFRFTANTGTLFSAQLTPVGQTYDQASEGSEPAPFASQAENDLVLRVYDTDQKLVAQSNSAGAGASERLSDVALAAAGVYYVTISGADDAAQLYQLDLSVSSGNTPEAIDFRQHTIATYGGPQDHSGTVSVENNGSTLRLQGNRWKMIDFPYMVTPNTVLEFDFASSSQGEIHGIGFDSNTSISSGLTFRVFGTQQWGHGVSAKYASQGVMQHFEIPVGKYYTGNASNLVFVNDHDVINPGAESVFANVRVYERDSKLQSTSAPHTTNDRVILNEDSPTVALNVLANDDSDGTRLSIVAVSAPSAGGTAYAARDGRIHYRPAADYHGTETFTYTAAAPGGSSTATVTVTVRPKNDPPVAGNDTYRVTTGRSYRLNVLGNDSSGPDVGEPLNVLGVGPTSAGGVAVTDGNTVIYTPPSGFVGTETFVYTINDGTPGSNATARITIDVRPSDVEAAELLAYRFAHNRNSRDALDAVSPQDSGRLLRPLSDTWQQLTARIAQLILAESRNVQWTGIPGTPSV